MYLIMGYSVLLGETVSLRIVDSKEEGYKYIEQREAEQALLPENKHIWYYRIQSL